MALTREQVRSWLDAYVEAWRSNDEAAIRALFADGARYAHHPYDEPLAGSAAIVESWLSDRDEPGTWSASYAPFLIEGDTAIVKGETRYATGDVFSNLFELDFDADGRCARFVEWYVRHPRGG